ncbi:MAG: hypothetical protein IK130_05595 [Oscillospiraceae bacterium]|nr:hypothetical protein [Oscillospiraceae bacterium]
MNANTFRTLSVICCIISLILIIAGMILCESVSSRWLITGIVAVLQLVNLFCITRMKNKK